MQFVQLYTQAGNVSLVNDVALAKQAVNDAIREIIAETGGNFTESPITNLDAGVYKYTFSGKFTSIPLRIQYMMYSPAGVPGNIVYQLVPETMQRVLELQANSSAATGSVRLYSIGDLDTFYLYPTPGPGDTIRMYFSSDITDYTVDASVPTQVPAHLHYCIVYLAARNLAIINNAQMVAELEPLAQAALAKIKEFALMRKANRPMRARVGYPQSQVIVDRSQYWTGDG